MLFAWQFALEPGKPLMEFSPTAVSYPQASARQELFLVLSRAEIQRQLSELSILLLVRGQNSVNHFWRSVDAVKPETIFTGLNLFKDNRNRK
jgi:deoxyribodipyrimidine photolyase